MKQPFLPLLLLLLLAAPGRAHAQGKYLTKAGVVTFFSATPIEDIEARNQQVAAVLDLGTSQLAFSLPVTGFVFKRTLMQEHFNENYMESEKFPKATFTGRFTGADAATLAAAGPHAVQVEGSLTMHGVTQRIQVPASLELKNGQLLAAATFTVATADYHIEIPLLVRDKIAKTVSVRVNLACNPAPGAVGATTPPAAR
ncbi:YceI family protein [Hymenobacter sp.]|uniref:YceI family protein n=1 Tax=Hymenobacter sp. TaxID=1898978 RepID=UPI00286A03B8|nr:YceI family protein [Hymenobacter sp.]